MQLLGCSRTEFEHMQLWKKRQLVMTARRGSAGAGIGGASNAGASDSGENDKIEKVLLRLAERGVSITDEMYADRCLAENDWHVGKTVNAIAREAAPSDRVPTAPRVVAPMPLPGG